MYMVRQKKECDSKALFYFLTPKSPKGDFLTNSKLLKPPYMGGWGVNQTFSVTSRGMRLRCDLLNRLLLFQQNRLIQTCK